MTQQAPSVVYLVRHAEKANDVEDDVDLSSQGHARAQRLAVLLQDQPIDRVYVTALQRTRQTAAAIIAAKQPLVQQLPASAAFLHVAAQELTTLPAGCNALVVTHVQYLTSTLTLLGVRAPRIHAHEFDHLFIVHRLGSQANLVHLRYP